MHCIITDGHVKIITVFAVDQRGVGKELVVDNMIPSCCGGDVSPVETHCTSKVEIIPAQVTRKI
jgi:hypothetical protein